MIDAFDVAESVRSPVVQAVRRRWRVGPYQMHRDDFGKGWSENFLRRNIGPEVL